MMNRNFYLDDGYSSTEHSESSDSDSWFGGVDEPSFGILFDVDGVIARGSKALSPAVEAIKLLTNHNKDFCVPVAFVTNSCSRSEDKAAIMSCLLGVNVDQSIIVQAPTPCRVLTEYHDKHTLIIGQEYRKEIAAELGFNHVCFIEDVRDAYPLLDMVNHGNRKKVSKGYREKPLSKIEAVLLLGEPTEWESHLQLLMDILLTEGSPSSAPADIKTVPQLPVIACNMDLLFMAEACMPRFGHGAFLLCLEQLYKKITGKEFKYSVLVGKPCEMTYRYAEHVINIQAKKMGISHPIKSLYLIGDNHEVDIVGSNLYHRYVKNVRDSIANGNDPSESNSLLPLSRQIHGEKQLSEQTVERCRSVLVCTGVYKPDNVNLNCLSSVYHGHRDITPELDLIQPTQIANDVLDGIKYILQAEQYVPKCFAAES